VGNDYRRAAPANVPGPGFARELVVPAACDGMRLDQALARLLPEHSRARLKGWIEAGLVRLAGAAATTPRTKVAPGQVVVVHAAPEPPALADAGEAIALAVVHEDDAILVVDKPAGLVVHPGAGNPRGTLLNALLHHAPSLATLPRAGIVHRLDKDTSGLMVVAKTATAQTDLVRQLQARSVSRQYLALACGDLAHGATVDAPIGRHPTARTRMAVVARGKPARTHVDVLERHGAVTLLSCRLETGRTHQIRVHLASIGHPLVGDPVYGGGRSARLPPLLRAFPRQALHAARLALVHPVTGKPLAWTSPLPRDFADLLAAVDATAKDART
jgi:23S rRNA pseudouridine1911/1915/1917 synthase